MVSLMHARLIKINNIDISAKVGLYPEEAYNAYKSANPDMFIQASEEAKYDILSVVNTITQMQFSTPKSDVANEKKSGFSLFKSKKNK